MTALHGDAALDNTPGGKHALPPARIALAGLGTVGSGVVNLLQRHAELYAARAGRPPEIIAVNARSKEKKRDCDISGIGWADSPAAIAQCGADIVVETIGGEDGDALTLAEAALTSGAVFVTSNKALVAKHGAKLAALAERCGGALLYEGAVAGGIPVIKTLKEALAGNYVTRVTGILNGTSNYMLSAMEKDGRGFAEILAEAQELGYAEADPTFDVDGIDAAHKTALIAALAFGVAPDAEAVHTAGIRDITPADFSAARACGYTIRLTGSAVRREDGIACSVYPACIPLDHPLASVTGPDNAVFIEGDAVGTLFLRGPGAGMYATASAVVGDIIDAARGNITPPFGIPSSQFADVPRLNDAGGTRSYFFRTDTGDADSAQRALAEAGITVIDMNAGKESGVSGIAEHVTRQHLTDILKTTAPQGAVQVLRLYGG